MLTSVVLTFSPAAPVVGQDVNFNAAASRPAPGRTIRSDVWEFGERVQKTTTTATTSHYYLQAGNYNVTARGDRRRRPILDRERLGGGYA